MVHFCLKFCSFARNITEGLFREYIALSQHMYESQMTVLNVLHTLTGGPLDFKALGFSLSILYVNPALPYCCMFCDPGQ